MATDTIEETIRNITKRVEELRALRINLERQMHTLDADIKEGEDVIKRLREHTGELQGFDVYSSAFQRAFPR